MIRFLLVMFVLFVLFLPTNLYSGRSFVPRSRVSQKSLNVLSTHRIVKIVNIPKPIRLIKKESN